MPRRASPRSAASTSPAVAARTTSPSCVLWTSPRFTHTGMAPGSGVSLVPTIRLGMNGTSASSSTAIIRSR
jgi:hypothetical protein